MTRAFDVWPVGLAAALERGGDGDLSELALLAHHPALQRAAALLLLAGLVCDLVLLVRWLRRARAPTPGPAGPWRVGPKPWGLRELGLVTAGLVGTVVGLSYLGAVVTSFAKLGEQATWQTLLVSELTGRLAVVIFVVWQLRREWPGWLAWFGLPPARWAATLARGGIAYLAALPPVVATMALVDLATRLSHIPITRQPAVDLLLTTDSRLTIGLVVVFAVAVAPVFEEWFFRGFAYPALKQRFGPVPALVLVGLLFGLAHAHLPSLAPLLVLGIALGLTYEASGSLVAPILVHALFNAANIGMLLLLRAAL